ncbi:hypothetical protein F2Q70_00017956 [Brassica cretica]|uniref:Uncharacterized protein n=1 Tax=Brassica cretica TaxID=69181 RepID=A0A8S9I0U9_BRACR|nr:hypothetical protein F2Q70_00017956 [Brassica cretica]
MMHNRIYCLWLNKEEESDSQLEITNRLCLVSGCEGCCLVVEYDDHWLSELWFRTFVSSSPICLAGRFEGAGDLRASPSQPRDAPRREAGCLYAGEKPMPLTPLIERASIDGLNASSSWAWVSKTSPTSPSTSPWLAASLSPLQHIKVAELSSTTYVHHGTCPLMLNLLKFDEERLWLNLMVLWPQHGNVGGWSPCLNSTTAYPSTTIELMYQVIKVKVSHSLEPVSTHLSTKPRTVTMSLVYMEITSVVHSSECSRTGVHGTVSTASPSVSSNNMFSGTPNLAFQWAYHQCWCSPTIFKPALQGPLSSVVVPTIVCSSVSGFQVKHVYGFLTPLTLLSLIVVLSAFI